jgi:hypothetical protein
MDVVVMLVEDKEVVDVVVVVAVVEILAEEVLLVEVEVEVVDEDEINHYFVIFIELCLFVFS